MNFLLYMMGRGTGSQPLRASVRHGLMAQAATHAGAGGFDAAAGCYTRLAEDGNLVDRLILGQLYVVLGDSDAAQNCLAAALEELLDGDLSDAPQNQDAAPLAQALDSAERLLLAGRYQRAMDLLRRARSRLEVILAAEGLLALAGKMENGHLDLTALETAARMGDGLLNLMARVQLVRHVAAGLSGRRLRGDLASWATAPNRVRALLEREFSRLRAAAENCPGHAQTFFRCGLLARVIGLPGRGAPEFTKVLAIHPGHAPSAARLAIARSHMSLPHGEEMKEAFCVPPETLALFGRVARAAESPRELDLAAETFCAGLDPRWAPAARGNLALALADAGVEGVPAQWRELFPTGVPSPSGASESTGLA